MSLNNSFRLSIFSEAVKLANRKWQVPSAVIKNAAEKNIPVKRKRSTILLNGPTCLALRCFSSNSSLVPPRAALSKNFFDKQNETYSYLKDIKNPDTKSYLLAEKYFFEKRVEELDLGETKEELLDTAIYFDSLEKLENAPERYGDYYYYPRYPPDCNLAVFCRKHIDNSSQEEVLIDLNSIAETLKDSQTPDVHESFKADEEDGDFVRLGEIKISPDSRYIACTISFDSGAEWFNVYIKDLETGCFQTSQILRRAHSIEWGDIEIDGNAKEKLPHSLYYSVSDELARPYQIFRHCLGDDIKNDELIYEENDPSFFVDVAKTKDGKFLVINSNSKSTSEVRIVPANAHLLARESNQTGIILMQKRIPGLQYFVDHAHDSFFLVTNHNFLPDYGLMQIPSMPLTHSIQNGLETTNLLGKENWRPVKAKCLEQDEVIKGVEELDVFSKHLVVYRRINGKQFATVLDRSVESYHKGFHAHNIDFSKIFANDSSYRIHPGANHVYDTDSVRINVSSVLKPDIPCEYNLKTQEIKILSAEDFALCNNFNCAEMFVEPSQKSFDKDGNLIRIPVTITYNNEFTPGKDKPRPLLLTAYGAYGHNNEPAFDAGHQALLSRGWIIAHAHVRGGGELGRYWYEDGRGDKKWNTFNDFVDIADYLVKHGYSEPSRLCATAVSAGGLTLAVAAIERPDLFAAMVLKVPFLDVLDSMMDNELPLTTAEFEEWGNPQKDEEAYNLIASYDPCKNVQKMLTSHLIHDNKDEKIRRKGTPALLVTCSLADMRVGYWGPAKFVAKIREQERSDVVKVENVLLHWSTDEGHFGAGGRYGKLEEQAFEFAFLEKFIV